MSISQKKRVYLDYQASTPVDPLVMKEMLPYFDESFGNPHASEHSFGWEAMKAVEQARQSVAKAINADSEEIVFTSGATESNNLALLGVAKANKTNRRKILVSAIEHKCVLQSAKSLEDQGYQVILLPVDKEGIVHPEILREHLDEDVLIVSIMAVNNEIGTIEPITTLAELTHEVGALFHTDAAQALAAIVIDVNTNPIDLLSLSGHKIYGPKGIGALYINRLIKGRIQPILYGGGQEDGYRSGTLPTPLCVGFGKAAELMKEKYNEDFLRLQSLRNSLLKGIQGVFPNMQINGPSFEKRHPGNLNVHFPGMDAKSLIQMLQPSISVSTGSACTSGIEEPSYVLREIGLSYKAAQSSMRFSVGRFTNEEEIEQVIYMCAQKMSLV